MIEDAPAGLLLDLDERMHVELGPARSRNLGPAMIAALALVYGAALSLLILGHAVGLAVLVAGTVVLAAARLGAFWFTEAPLRLSWDERRLLLQRHFRGRILWQRALSWAELDGIERPAGGDLQLLLASGRRLVLSAAFRTEEQLDWIAARLQDALGQHQALAAESVELAAEHRPQLQALLDGLDRRREPPAPLEVRTPGGADADLEPGAADERGPGRCEPL